MTAVIITGRVGRGVIRVNCYSAGQKKWPSNFW